MLKVFLEAWLLCCKFLNISFFSSIFRCTHLMTFVLHLQIECEAWIRKGDPQDTICHEVKRIQPDLLVVGCRGLGPFQRYYRVSMVSQCSIMFFSDVHLIASALLFWFLMAFLNQRKETFIILFLYLCERIVGSFLVSIFSKNGFWFEIWPTVYIQTTICRNDPSIHYLVCSCLAFTDNWVSNYHIVR